MNTIPADDRGLQYGDGLFETMRFVAGNAPLWDWHMQRLALGCERLRLPLPSIDDLRRETQALASAFPHCVIKLLWTAGSGPRGYARPAPVAPRLLLSAQAWRPGAPTDLRLRWCELRMARQPRLAGIKHLNRIEQVLARSEWETEAFDEGLMLDTAGRVVSAIAANVCVRRDGQWLTPPINECGVAGVARRWMIEQGAQVCELTVADVLDSEQCVLTSAVHGPRAARSLDARVFAPDAAVRALQARWATLFAEAS